MNKAGLIQVFDGSPDCTSTFVSERKLFQAATSLGFSQVQHKSAEQDWNLSFTTFQSLNISVVKSRSPSKLMRIKGSESLPIPLKLQENSKRGCLEFYYSFVH